VIIVARDDANQFVHEYINSEAPQVPSRVAHIVEEYILDDGNAGNLISTKEDTNPKKRQTPIYRPDNIVLNEHSDKKKRTSEQKTPGKGSFYAESYRIPASPTPVHPPTNSKSKSGGMWGRKKSILSYVQDRPIRGHHAMMFL
jgi:hypothetical protein